MSDYSIVGDRVNRVDGLVKVTGRANYAADISLPNMLYGKILWSTCPHARIHRLDVLKAQTLAGVMAVITAADIPQQKGDQEYLDPMTCCLAREKVIFAGQPVAAVAAVNLHTAEKALGLIEVDYDELPAVIDVLDAMKPDAPLVHPNSYIRTLNETDSKPSNIFWYVENNRGDVEAGFREADIVLENTFRTHMVHQGYLEPRASVVSADPGGKITIWADNQGIFELQELAANFLNLPLNRIKAIPVEVGGAFGGKSYQIAPILCALLAQKAGRPVKIVTTRDEVFKTGRPTPSSVITVKIGVSNEGYLTAVSATMVYDFGALHGMGGLPEVPAGYFTGLSPYRISNSSTKCFSVYTNKIPSGPYRAPTAAQAAFAIESQMDLVARSLGMDPLEFRLKNIAGCGDPLSNGRHLPKVGFKETLERMREYLAQRDNLEGKNRSWGVACGYWDPGSGSAGASVRLNGDGTVTLLVGSVDISGSRTALAQMVAEEMGIPVESVSAITGDTETAPFSIPSVGSMITRSLAKPICEACQDVKNQLCRKYALQIGVKPEDVEFGDGQIVVKGIPQKSVSFADYLTEQARHSFGGFLIIGQGSSERCQPAPVLVVEAAEVGVDKETGKVKILSFVAAQDTGLAINPVLVESQMQGAVAQGIGWALTENSIFHKGIMQNATLLDYRMPTAADLPFLKTLLVEVGSDTSPFGIRGVGEPPIIPSLAAVANAIHSAVGVRLKELPMTPEAVFWALKAENRLGRDNSKKLTKP